MSHRIVVAFAALALALAACAPAPTQVTQLPDGRSELASSLARGGGGPYLALLPRP